MTIDLTPRLEGVLTRLTEALTGRYVSVATFPMEATGEAESPEPEPAPEPAEIKEEAPEATTEAAPSPTSYPSDEEMRQQMDMTISKFAGNGWKESKDGRTLGIKKGCTSAFKEIAKWLGADKPTALLGDKRNEFVKRLEEIFIEEKGEGKVPEIVFRPF